MIFEKAWEIAKMGYPGMPLDETSAYYEAVRERLGLGEPFDTGEQRRVFNIPGQPNFVAKVVNDGGEGGATTFVFDDGETDSGFWEDYVYPSLARVIPKTAEKYLVPGETMGLNENISGVVRQPRVNVHPRMLSNDFSPKANTFRDNFLTSALEELHDAAKSRGFAGLNPDFLLSEHLSPKAKMDRMNDSMRNEIAPILEEIKEFLFEQDYGYSNFTDDMKLLDYYAAHIKPGRVFR